MDVVIGKIKVITSFIMPITIVSRSTGKPFCFECHVCVQALIYPMAAVTD